jgi:hypothetical protein
LFAQVGTVYQLIITISILLSQVLGMGSVLGNEAGWPFLLGLTIIPGILQVNPVENRFWKLVLTGFKILN